jgi:hypothetical protein
VNDAAFLTLANEAERRIDLALSRDSRRRDSQRFREWLGSLLRAFPIARVDRGDAGILEETTQDARTCLADLG